jgi:tetratricopeptide (TPR) repeat protein
MADNESGLQSSLSGLSGDFVRTYKFFYGFLLLGLVFVLIAEWSNHPVTALLWSFACLSCGGFVGFLFGIPRVLQQDVSPARAATTQQGGSAGTPTDIAGNYTIRVNTNLEQISDWLTKIIVGITLIQLQKVPENLNRAATFIAYSFSGPSDKFFAGAVIIFFSIGGFLGGYLFTRLFLTGAFYRADQPGLPISQSEKNEIAKAAVPVQTAMPSLTGAAALAAKKLVDVSLDQLTTPSDISVWAKSQLDAKNYAEAVRGYSKAVSLNPDDISLRVDYALALRAAGSPLEVVKAQLLDAYKRLTPETDKKVKERVYNALTYTFVYLPPPDGFNNAIKYGEEYVADPANPTNGDIYRTLAAAYGQQYKWFKDHQDPSVDLKAIRAKALAAIKTSITLNPQWKDTLRMLFDPKYPNKDLNENDLEVFIDDEEFRLALGMPPLT